MRCYLGGMIAVLSISLGSSVALAADEIGNAQVWFEYADAVDPDIERPVYAVIMDADKKTWVYLLGKTKGICGPVQRLPADDGDGIKVDCYVAGASDVFSAGMEFDVFDTINLTHSLGEEGTASSKPVRSLVHVAKSEMVWKFLPKKNEPTAAHAKAAKQVSSPEAVSN